MQHVRQVGRPVVSVFVQQFLDLIDLLVGGPVSVGQGGCRHHADVSEAAGYPQDLQYLVERATNAPSAHLRGEVSAIDDPPLGCERVQGRVRVTPPVVREVDQRVKNLLQEDVRSPGDLRAQHLLERAYTRDLVIGHEAGGWHGLGRRLTVGLRRLRRHIGTPLLCANTDGQILRDTDDVGDVGPHSLSPPLADHLECVVGAHLVVRGPAPGLGYPPFLTPLRVGADEHGQHLAGVFVSLGAYPVDDPAILVVGYLAGHDRWHALRKLSAEVQVLRDVQSVEHVRPHVELTPVVHRGLRRGRLPVAEPVCVHELVELILVEGFTITNPGGQFDKHIQCRLERFDWADPRLAKDLFDLRHLFGGCLHLRLGWWRQVGDGAVNTLGVGGSVIIDRVERFVAFVEYQPQLLQQCRVDAALPYDRTRVGRRGDWLVVHHVEVGHRCRSLLQRVDDDPTSHLEIPSIYTGAQDREHDRGHSTLFRLPQRHDRRLTQQRPLRIAGRTSLGHDRRHRVNHPPGTLRTERGNVSDKRC